MELRHLRYFIAVADSMSFRQAAANLHMTQPPLSQQIKQLEDELGVLLFERDGRSIRLTAAGERFLPEARRILDNVDYAAEQARQAARGEVGQLTIGFVGTVAYQLLPMILRVYRSDYPAVRLHLQELTSSQQRAALMEGKIDVGFARVSQPMGDDLHIENVREEQFVAVLPEGHPLAEQSHIAVAQLKNDPFVLFPAQLGLGLHEKIVGMCHEAGFSPHITQTAIQLPTIVGLVAGGMGVSVLPASVTAFAHQGVRYVPLTQSAMTTISMMRLDGQESPVLGRFVECVRAVVY